MPTITCDHCFHSENVNFKYILSGFGECTLCGNEYCPKCGEKGIHFKCLSEDDNTKEGD